MNAADIIEAMLERIGILSRVGRRLTDEEQAEVDRLTRGMEAMVNGPQPPAPIESSVSDLRDDECSGWTDNPAG